MKRTNLKAAFTHDDLFETNQYDGDRYGSEEGLIQAVARGDKPISIDEVDLSDSDERFNGSRTEALAAKYALGYVIGEQASPTTHTRFTFVVRPGEEWRMSILQQLWRHRRQHRWDVDLERFLGRMLGYQERNITAWLEFRSRSIVWCPRDCTLLVLCPRTERSKIEACGMRSLSPDTDLSSFVFLYDRTQQDLRVRSNAAEMFAAGIVLLRTAVTRTIIDRMWKVKEGTLLGSPAPKWLDPALFNQCITHDFESWENAAWQPRQVRDHRSRRARRR